MYFVDDEFKCKCCGKLEGDHELHTILRDRLEKLRKLWGHPIYVSCGYRCPAHNDEVKGAPNSQHVQAAAADIYTNDGDYKVFYETVVDSRLFDGIGYYPVEEFVHVDVRNYGRTPNEYNWEG